MMRDHLAEFKRANGQQATFKGWIAMLHPENVMLDHGLDLSDNRWLAMWNEAQTAHEPEPASSVDPSLDIDPSDDSRDMYVRSMMHWSYLLASHCAMCWDRPVHGSALCSAVWLLECIIRSKALRTAA